ncbi:MAG TPA: response regulator [Candidatus Tyrphobacter sp.]
MATILIADDDTANRLLVVTLLKHAGHTVFEASDGAAALQYVGERRFDLVLVDLSMPGLSGAEFIRTVRAGAHDPTVAIALYTGTPENTAIREFMEIYGVRCAISKPSEPRDFLRAIETALQGGDAT